MQKINKKKIILIIILIVVGISANGRAEQKRKPLILDWDTAWMMALNNNESHKIVYNELDKAKKKVGEAYSAAMPVVDFNGVFSHYFEVPVNPVTMPGELNFVNPGQPFQTEFKFGQENNISAGIQLTQPLWIAGKVGIALKIAKIYEEMSEYGVRISKEDLYIKLKEVYYGVVVAERAVIVAEEAMQLVETHRDKVIKLYEKGVVSEYDLIRSKVAVSNMRPNYINAEATRDIAYKGLKNIVGINIDDSVVVKTDIDINNSIVGYEYDKVINEAMKRRKEIKQLVLKEELYKYQEKIEKRGWLWPNIMAGFKWETLSQSEKLNINKYKFNNGISGQVIVHIPLFDGFASRKRSQIARINARNVMLKRNMLERGIKVQVYQAMRSAEKSAEELKATEENRMQAEKAYDIAVKRYNEGVGTQLEVLDAQLMLNTSKMNVLQTKYEKIMAEARYKRAVGLGFSKEKSD